MIWSHEDPMKADLVRLNTNIAEPLRETNFLVPNKCGEATESKEKRSCQKALFSQEFRAKS